MRPTAACAALLLAPLPLAAALAGPAAAQTPCARRPDCAEVTAFVAGVTDFRTSQVDRGTRLVTATVHFRNKTNRPLVLGYVGGSGIVTDDEGNRYVAYGADAVRGIGTIASNTFDPKFALQPGEASDARFEFTLRLASANQILGTRYAVELAVREIDPVAGGQFRLGREHALRFRGFGGGDAVASGGAGAGAAPAVPLGTDARQTAGDAVPTSTPPAERDPCAGRPRCYGAGPFVAEVAQLTPSRLANNTGDHLLRVEVRFRNLTAHPLILAYKTGTSVATDNLGNRYHWGRPGTHDVSVSGIGKVEGPRADPQFVLDPGQARTATFDVRRFRTGRGELGTRWGYDLAVLQLEPLPSGQVRVGREYSVSFRDLGPGAWSGAPALGPALGTTGASVSGAVNQAVDGAVNEAGRRLMDGLRRRLKKPQ